MESLPDDVEATLLRGVAAYLRATFANELPSNLRRFQNFRPKGLATHKRQLLDSLDADGFRARILEWLDERPSLPKADVAVLRVAAARTDGWHEELGAGAAPKPARSRTPAASDEAAGREREKLRRAREEAKKRLDESQRRSQALQARVAELESKLESEASSRTALEKQVTVARRDADKATTELERERRKAKSSVEKAQEAATKARSDLKEARREIQTLKRAAQVEAEKTAASTKAKSRARKKPGPSRPRGPRRALAVPKGRFEDDPATLEAWLDADGVHLLVDGYNATMSRSGYGNLDLAGQRQRLVDEVTKLARRKGIKATIVFDGSDVVGSIRQPRGPAKFQYSAPDEIADDHLVGLLESMPPSPVIVATSDRELQERAASLGGTVANSEQLLSLLR